MSVPPWFSALHVLVQVTVQVAPDAHVTLEPAPTVSVQSLPGSHVTLAEAPAVSLQVAWLWQLRFELSAAVTVQSVFAAHCVLQPEPHAPVHVAVPPQAKVQALVWAVQAPVPLKLQAPLAVHEHAVPVQLAGTPMGVLDPDEPQATAKQRKRLAKNVLDASIKGPPKVRAQTKEPLSSHALDGRRPSIQNSTASGSNGRASSEVRSVAGCEWRADEGGGAIVRYCRLTSRVA